MNTTSVQQTDVAMSLSRRAWLTLSILCSAKLTTPIAKPIDRLVIVDGWVVKQSEVLSIGKAK